MAVDVTAEQINEVKTLSAWRTPVEVIQTITGLDEPVIRLILSGQSWNLKRKPAEPSEAEAYEARRKARQATREASMKEAADARRIAWEVRRSEIHARLDMLEGKTPQAPTREQWDKTRYFLNRHQPRVPKED